jgi:pyruvate,water dikinase
MSLGSMISAGFPVPPGFAVTTEAYRAFLASSGLEDAVREALEGEDSGALGGEDRARAVLEAASLGGPIGDDVRSAYRRLCEARGGADIAVAIRSSGTHEDSDHVSFAGEHTTHLWVRGEEAVAARVVSCWASLFTPRALGHRRTLGLPLSGLAMAVAVQEMVEARVSGVMFTLNPITGDPSKIVIEGSFGLGTASVEGEVDPDRYFVDKVTLRILKREIATKRIAYRVVNDEVRRVDLAEAERAASSLRDEEVSELARLGKALETHYGCPLDIEWALREGESGQRSVALLQSRPETVFSRRPRAPVVTSSGGALGLVLSTMMQAGKNRGRAAG